METTETWLEKCERLALEARRREQDARAQAEDWERRAYVERRCQRALARYEGYYRLLDALLSTNVEGESDGAVR